MNILLIEDNPGDVRLTQEALKETDAYPMVDLAVVPDGEEALKYLRRQGEYAEATRPDIIFLDLNIPKKDGKVVLKELKSDPDLQVIPVIVLTTSDTPGDIMETYGLHANSFITKPVDMNHFIEVVRVIEQFWFRIAQLPPRK
ncbi:MAG: response regulator [Bacteroidetes bacterium]|nr:MAG: response regulator [Bacteroidota bacterium]